MCGIKKFEQITIYSRKPLDPKDNKKEFMRIRQIAKDVVSKFIPEYNFDKRLAVTN